MGKLHEVLAVEGGLKTTTDKILRECTETFNKKQGHFLGQYRHYEKVREDSIDYLPEEKELVETVWDKIDYVNEHLVRSLDATYQKEITNKKAKADIVIDGNTIAKDIPATYLLGLESRLNEIRSVYLSIPTLDPGKSWAKDAERKNTYVSKEVESLKTEKVIEPLTLAQATKEHPAQVQVISLDKIVGKWKTKYFSGAITSAEKSDLLARLDKLLRAVKQARMRANNEEVDEKEIAKSLIDFIKG